MTHSRLEAAVPDGEALRYHASLRSDGVVGFTDERLLVCRDDVTSVDLESVHSVEYEDFDWFVGVLSAGLVAFGLYSTRMNLLAGLFFAAAGVASLYISYRKRGKATVKVRGRAKPLVVYPEDGSEFYRVFEGAIESYQERLDAEHATTKPEG